MSRIPVRSTMRPRRGLVRLPVGGYVQTPEVSLVEEKPLAEQAEEEVAAPVVEEPKTEVAEAPAEEAPVTSVDPLAGLSPTSTKAALQAKADELGLTVPDGAKRSDIWNLLKAHVSV